MGFSIYPVTSRWLLFGDERIRQARCHEILHQPLLHKRLHDRRIGKCRGIAELVYLAVRDLPEDTAHDLAAPRLREAGRELQLVGRGDRTDDRTDMAGEDLLELVRRFKPVLERHVHIDTFTLDVMRITDDRSLCNRFVADER